jgi:hypothetical protein
VNKPVWQARILRLGGVIETLIGLGLLIDPSAVVAVLLGSPLQGTGIVIGHIAGGGLLSLGIACWGARKSPSTPASIGVSWGFLAYNVVACVTLAWSAPSLDGGGLPAISASVLHGVFGVALLGILIGRGQSPGAP